MNLEIVRKCNCDAHVWCHVDGYLTKPPAVTHRPHSSPTDFDSSLVSAHPYLLDRLEKEDATPKFYPAKFGVTLEDLRSWSHEQLAQFGLRYHWPRATADQVAAFALQIARLAGLGSSVDQVVNDAWRYSLHVIENTSPENGEIAVKPPGNTAKTEIDKYLEGSRKAPQGRKTGLGSSKVINLSGG